MCYLFESNIKGKGEFYLGFLVSLIILILFSFNFF